MLFEAIAISEFLGCMRAVLMCSENGRVCATGGGSISHAIKQQTNNSESDPHLHTSTIYNTHRLEDRQNRKKIRFRPLDL